MATAGPNSPSTAADTASPGINAWTSVNNAKASDNTYATCQSGSGNATNYLRLTGFGFSIPAGNSISGIQVDCEFKVDANPMEGGWGCLVKGGTQQTAKLNTWGSFPTVDTYVTIGSSSDLWSNTWTVSDINDTNFGCDLIWQRFSTPNGTVSVDHVRVTVTYTPASGGPHLTQTRQAVMRAATR